ncbi:WecB/TagA/CpsF family glycosyltransferase [Hydrogenophaga defluvii]|uniref:WecB/TagA/CpsF family glycosyltransferase n=1 Tax=Hydrogenophaga defluvii TaxID=249410 RepID=A0ABW2S8R4_9BURK
MTDADTGWLGRWRDVLSKLTPVADATDRSQLLARMLAPDGKVKILAFVNAHAMNMVAQQPCFCRDLLNTDFLLRDGSGMRVLMSVCGQAPGLNMNGTDFIPELLNTCKGKTVALWGTQLPYLEAAQRNLELQAGVRCVSVLDGFLPTEAYCDALKTAQPDVVILGMGMPKQEKVAVALAELASRSCLVVCGGAILDFLGGKVDRAPALFRRLGLEWLYRLVLEPRRLFKRYVLGNPLFLFRTAWFRSRVGRCAFFGAHD